MGLPTECNRQGNNSKPPTLMTIIIISSVSMGATLLELRRAANKLSKERALLDHAPLKRQKGRG